MRIQNLLKIVLGTSVLAFSVIYQNSFSSSLALRNVNDLGFDKSLIFQEGNYGQAKKIIVAPIILESDEIVSDTDWIKGIFYYQTSKLTFGDMTYHYIVTRDGTVYKGNSKGVDQRFNVSPDMADAIVIGYLAKSDDVDFKSSAKDNIKELLLDIANNQQISSERIYIRDITYEVDTGGIVSPKITDIIAGRWNKSFEKIVMDVALEYTPVAKEYKIDFEKIVLPANAVNYGEVVLAKITIKNDSEHVLYQDSDFEPLISKTTGSFSKFYVNDVWLSLTQAPIMKDGDFIPPGESKTYELRIGVPLYLGKQTESFELINSLGEKYNDTAFDIELNVNRPEGEIVEITSTGAGYLNVRGRASGFGEVVSRVTPGQRYLVVERSDTGWVKIDLENGQMGWVARQYTKKI